MTPTDATSAIDTTRAALIAAGFALFGRQGYSATSTRQIAARAQTNVASIAYHFGSKEGLRFACGKEFAARLASTIGLEPTTIDQSPAEAHQALQARFKSLISFTLEQSDAGDLVSFMLRELAEDSPVVDHVYSVFLEQAHRHLCALWGRASGCAAESDAVRLAVFSYLGQVLYFRFGGRVVARRMNWSETGPAEVAKVTATLLANLDAMLGATGRE